jgi:hypothetical protein
MPPGPPGPSLVRSSRFCGANEHEPHRDDGHLRLKAHSLSNSHIDMPLDTAASPLLFPYITQMQQLIAAISILVSLPREDDVCGNLLERSARPLPGARSDFAGTGYGGTGDRAACFRSCASSFAFSCIAWV